MGVGYQHWQGFPKPDRQNKNNNGVQNPFHSMENQKEVKDMKSAKKL